MYYFFFSSRRRHTRFSRDWSSDVCSSDLDRIQFRRPFGRQAVNGELATVEKIEGGRFTVKTKEGALTIDTKTFRHFDFGYAVTSYLSQGQTSEREIVYVDTRSSD